ncbi:MAG: hypothetical protein WC231_01120 [Dehalococcoidales bacterium]|jgi:zinc transporter ZupT|nr:hypothetical protein [Dehalococcoidales bacterium]MDD5604337.1 hypothetical protein [Dehalococcoidales bacterium]
MKKVGLVLLAISVIALIGAMIWVMVTGAESIPVVMYVIFGAAGLGVIILLAVAIYESKKQGKQETFERRKN